MTVKSMMLNNGLNNDIVARLILERFIVDATAFRDCLIGYSEHDACSVAVYDALLSLSIDKAQEAVQLLGGVDLVCKEDF